MPPKKKSTLEKVSKKALKKKSLNSILDEDFVKQPKARVKKGEYVVELRFIKNCRFNTFDKQTLERVHMALVKGENTVPSEIFDAFLEDEFFKTKILGKSVMVIFKPGIDEVDV